MPDQTSEPKLTAEALLESLLFVASGPVPISQLVRVLELPAGAVRQILGRLADQYQTRGLRLQWLEEGVQLTTAPEASGVVERFLGLETVTTRLSQAALEVLSIIAYLQPITRPQIDELRGVNSDGALRTLLSKGLLEEVGRQEAPGRPILYGTTPQFMQQFGLSTLQELPALKDKDEG